MPRSRSIRFAGHAVRFVLFLLIALAAVRFLVGTVDSRGWGPGALLGLLVVTGAGAMLWRATLDLRKVARRLRS